MKTYKALVCVIISMLLMASCEKDAIDPVQAEKDPNAEFVVPEIPVEIAEWMSEEDILRFKAGPGKEYNLESELKSSRRGKWHPILMKLEFHLQIWPSSSCDTWSDTPCFPPDCMPMAASGFTFADGNWFFKSLHSEYYPVFCFPDYAGHGQGFHQTSEGKLWYSGENTPFMTDEAGNSTFRLNGRFLGDLSTGVFEGARGWEIMISYTAVENSPSNSPTGQGKSTTVIFGWAYY